MPELDVSPVQFKVRARPRSQVPVAPSSGARVIIVPVPGGRGPTGPAGDNAPVFGEIPGGPINGGNAVFSTLYGYASGSTALYLNGLRGAVGVTYTESGPNEITLDEAPLPGDILTIDYVIA